MSSGELGEIGWKPLSVREGRAEPEGPFEGVPAHIMRAVDEWLVEALEPRGFSAPDTLAQSIALLLHVSGDHRESATTWLRTASARDEDKALDIVDCTLRVTGGRTADRLRVALILGGSVWRVNDKSDGLVRRVSPTEQASFESAVAPVDAASENLRTAWGKLYGRHPDPSDAWDHAIKACEALLAPIVMPNNTQATLGSILSAIEAKPSKFTLGLTSSGRGVTGVETLAHMLRLIWPNPDRHPTGASRPPTPEEVRHVVHLAVLVVNWLRHGALTLA